MSFVFLTPVWASLSYFFFLFDDKEDGKVPGVVKWEYGSFILHSRDWSEVRWTTMAYTSFENEEKKENDDAMGERQYRRIIIHSFG